MNSRNKNMIVIHRIEDKIISSKNKTILITPYPLQEAFQFKITQNPNPFPSLIPVGH